jgi:hypothetical protein
MSSLLNKSNVEGEWTTRSVNFQEDLLQLFERGDFYDCTFWVSSKQTGEDKQVL